VSTTVLVVTADLQGDPTSIIKAFNDAQKASEKFRQQQEDESRKARSAWAKVSDMGADISKGFDSVAKMAESVGGKLTKGITLPAVGAAGALGGIAIAGGWGRLTSIENATKQIESLGYSSEEAGRIIGTDVLKSVEGTAFALQDAGTWAGAALASGIAPGQELTRQLTLIGDSATRANTDFGSMANMLTQVDGAGKLTVGMMTQMTENGLFVLPMLQKEFGKTATEIQDMVSKGDISAAQFKDILEKNVAGAALKSGDTAQGALANLKTSFSNLGATALNEVYPQLKEVFGELTAMFKSPEMKAAAADIGRVLADTFRTIVNGVRDVLNWFQSLSPEAKGAALAFAGIAIAAGPVLIVVGKIATGISALMTVISGVTAFINGWKLASAGAAAAQSVLTGATTVQAGAAKAGAVAQGIFNAVMEANPIIKIVAIIMLLVGALIYFFTQTELGQAIWAEFSRFLGEAWTNIVNVATTVFGALASFFTDTWNNISSFVTTVVGGIVSFFTDAWTNVSSFFIGVWTAVSTTFMDIWNGIVGFLTPIFEFIATLIRVYIETWQNIFLIFAAVMVTIWNAIVDVVTTVWNAIVAFLTPIVTFIVEMITNYITGLVSFWTGVWEAVSSFFVGVWNGIVDFITPIAAWLAAYITAYVEMVSSTWNTVWQAISDFFTTIWNAIVSFITPIVQSVQNAITNAVNTISSIWNSTWSAISSFLTDVWNNIVNAVRSAIDTVVSTVSGLWDQIMGFFSGAGQWLFDVGTDIIQGLINGITSMIDGVIGAISDTVNGAIDWAKNVLQIHSPSRVFVEIGEYTGEGMEVGIQNKARSIQRASALLIPEIPDPKALTAAWSINANTGTYGTPPWSSASPGSSTGSAPITIEVKVERSEIQDLDVDNLAEIIMQKVQYAMGGAVAP
jgi:tape measure domain-containing protein